MSSTPRLHLAVSRCDRSKVKKYIAEGDAINAVDEYGRTPLMIASESGHALKIVKLLLKFGGDPSLSCTARFLPLFNAAEQGHVAIAKALIDVGANCDAVNGDAEQTAVMIASFRGRVDVAQLLIEGGCDILRSSTTGTTALHAAACGGSSSILSMLLDAGADVNEVSGPRVQTSALVWAVNYKHLNASIELIRRGANVNYADLNGGTALHKAAELGCVDILEALLKAGANPNRVRCPSGTPLHHACARGHLTCVRMLLLAGARVSATDLREQTPLHYSVKQQQRGLNLALSHLEVIELLLASGSDPNAIDNEGRTALVGATIGVTFFGDARHAHLLLDAGCDINKLDNIGQSALVFAKKVESVRAFLARGASVDIVDCWGLSILQHAAYNGLCAGVICCLYHAGAHPTLSAVIARHKGHTDTAVLLDMLEAKYEQAHGRKFENEGAREQSISKVLEAVARVDVHMAEWTADHDSDEQKQFDPMSSLTGAQF